MSVPTSESHPGTLEALSQSLKVALATIRRTIPAIGPERPAIGQPDLTYKRATSPWWVEGFWSGQLWLAYQATGQDYFREAARAQRPYFVDRQAQPDSHDHDLGFLYSLSVVADYKLTGDPAARQLGLAAAASLAGRYNPAGRFIRAWNAWPSDTPQEAHRRQGKMIIDSLENLALLWWAAQESGQADYAAIALAHAHTAARHLVRPDGSTYHTFDFDPEIGTPLGGSTVQGYADESCWSRGQGWAIHGLGLAFAYTGVDFFLQTACQLADYALAHLPADGVPYWDYRLPGDAPHYRDTSAAAITAAGLLLLAEQPGQSAQTYRQAAHTILLSLSHNYSTAPFPQAEGLLRQGCAFVKQGLVDNMLPYGDYFYLEGLLRSLGHTSFFW